MGSKNHCETIKSLQICYLFNINLSHQILDVDELKRRIISEWAALSHTVLLLTVLLESGVSIYVTYNRGSELTSVTPLGSHCRAVCPRVLGYALCHSWPSSTTSLLAVP